MRTGMEPWFEFWQKVRYAGLMLSIEWRRRKTYRRTL